MRGTELGYGGTVGAVLSEGMAVQGGGEVPAPSPRSAMSYAYLHTHVLCPMRSCSCHGVLR
eukprot:3937529-Rhodomonas_salina.2